MASTVRERPPRPAAQAAGGGAERGRRGIRSYVLRPGRMTAGQQRAWDAHWPRWGLELGGGPLAPERCFGRVAPLVMEIGFGMGRSLAEQALASPRVDYLGVEVHRPGVGALFRRLAEQGSRNVRVYCEDAALVLAQAIADSALDGVQIFFPDPWHKRRHHKRRLIQAPFARLLARKIRCGGFLHLATDWQDYAGQMLRVVEADRNFANAAGRGRYSARPPQRPRTRFERRGLRLGHTVRDLYFYRR